LVDYSHIVETYNASEPKQLLIFDINPKLYQPSYDIYLLKTTIILPPLSYCYDFDENIEQIVKEYSLH
jgi:hypothetical protein